MRTSIKNFNITALLFVTASFSLGNFTSAEGSDWDNGAPSDSSWFSAENWASDLVPVATDFLTIVTTGEVISITGQTAVGSGLNLGQFIGTKGDLKISDAGKLDISRSVKISWRVTEEGSNVQSSLWVTGAGSSLDIGQNLSVAERGAGNLYIEDGGQVEADLVLIGDLYQSRGMVAVKGENSLLSSLSDFYVGNAGSGQLIVSEGGKVTSADAAIIGRYDSSNSSVQVTGTGSNWSNEGYILAGVHGTGKLAIEDRGTVDSGAGILGNEVGSTGEVHIKGPGSAWEIINRTSSFNFDGSIIVGNLGSGSLTIEDGGRLSNDGDGTIGEQAGSTGSVLVTGANSRWMNAGPLSVGLKSTDASLSIEDGGFVEAELVAIGDEDFSDGSVVVKGESSKFSVLNNLYVGNKGSGQLTVSDGGSVTSMGDAFVGRYTDSTGIAEVTGPGSTWINNGYLLVSKYGTGKLSIKDGGTVKSGAGVIGDASTSHGEVHVQGGGSVWNIDAILGADGQFFVGNFGSGSLTIADGGMVKLGLLGTGHVDMAAQVDSTGRLVIGQDPNVPVGDPLADLVGPGTLVAAELRLGGGDSTIIFNHSDNTGTYEFAPDIISPLDVPGVIEHYAGMTRLTGDDSNFFGRTNIYGGTLSIDNMLGGGVSVKSGGSLSGGGTANGDVTFNEGSYYRVIMDGTKNEQGLTIDGQALLTGGMVKLDGDYLTQTGQEIVVLTTTNPLTTQFAGVEQFDSIFLLAALRHGTNHVYATVSQKTLDSVANTTNHVSVANGLQSLHPEHELFVAVLAHNNEEAARRTFDEFSGENNASLNGALVVNGQQLVTAVTDRVSAAFDTGSSNTSTAAYGNLDDSANGFWMTGYGNWTKTDATFNTAAMDNTLGGVVAGYDRQVGDMLRLGVLGGYSQTSTTTDARASSADADSYTIGAYGGTDVGKAKLSFGALYTWHAIDSTRSVSFPIPHTLSADYNAHAFQLFAEAGYKIQADRVMLEPFAGVSYMQLKTDAYNETGGVSALSAMKETTSTTFTTLGARSSIELAHKVRAHGMVGWRHAFGDIDPSATFTIGGGAPFTVLGAPIAQDAAVLETGIDFNASDNVIVGASYEGQYGDGATAHGFNARMQVRF